MEDGRPTTDTPAATQGWSAPPQAREKPATDWARVSRVWFIVLALVVLSISLLVAMLAADQAVEVWLRPQYVPFFRLGGALVIAAVALVVVLRLTRRHD